MRAAYISLCVLEMLLRYRGADEWVLRRLAAYCGEVECAPGHNIS